MVAIHRVRPRGGLPLTALALLSLGAGAARAETSPYFIGASAGYRHESNLLRLGDNQTASAGLSRADSIWTTSLQAGLDQHLGRQRAYANLSLGDSRFEQNPAYNNQSYSASAGLDWSTVERFSGTLSATADRALASFNIVGIGLLQQKNLQSTQGLNATLKVGLVTEYTFYATAGHRQLSNSLQINSVQATNFSQDNGSLGLRWNPRGQTTLGLGLSSTRGRFPKFLATAGGEYLADRYAQNGLDLSASLQPSGVSWLDGRLSYSKTTFDLNQARDFSGLTGFLSWRWEPLGKLRLITRLARDTGQNAYAIVVFGLPGASDYSQLVNSLRLQADYGLSGKVTLTSALQFSQRRIVNTVQILGLDQSGRDLSTVLSFGARWNPLRSLQFGCDLSTERRSASGALTVPLKNHAVSCFGQLQLQP